MKVERNEVSPDRIKDVQPEDWVAVHLADNLNVVLYCQVNGVREDRLRVKVHSTDGINLIPATPGCLDWDTVIPWTSIGFMRHIRNKPVECACKDRG